MTLLCIITVYLLSSLTQQLIALVSRLARIGLLIAAVPDLKRRALAMFENKKKKKICPQNSPVQLTVTLFKCRIMFVVPTDIALHFSLYSILEH